MCAYKFKMFIFSCFYCYRKTAAVKPLFTRFATNPNTGFFRSADWASFFIC